MIDLILFYVLAILFGIALAIVSPSSIENLDSNSTGFDLLGRLISILLYAIYMGLVETIFKGKSLGKLITGTRAVNLDGSQISASTAFGRGFSRAIPFCAFSAFGYPCNPWQDKWTHTAVIVEKK